jgi:hypothetical protein
MGQMNGDNNTETNHILNCTPRNYKTQWNVAVKQTSTRQDVGCLTENTVHCHKIIDSLRFPRDGLVTP